MHIDESGECPCCGARPGEMGEYRRILEKFQVIYERALGRRPLGSIHDVSVPFALLRMASMALDDEDMAREATDD